MRMLRCLGEQAFTQPFPAESAGSESSFNFGQTSSPPWTHSCSPETLLTRAHVSCRTINSNQLPCWLSLWWLHHVPSSLVLSPFKGRETETLVIWTSYVDPGPWIDFDSGGGGFVSAAGGKGVVDSAVVGK